jgi:hypothetical protein
MQVPLRGTVGRYDEELAAHAEVREYCITRVERKPQVLPATSRTLDALPDQRGSEVVGTGEMPAYRTRMVDVDRCDASPGDAAFETSAYDLNFG